MNKQKEQPAAGKAQQQPGAAAAPDAVAGAPAAVATAPKVKKKVAANGVAHIKATFNNTLISLADRQGNVVAWNSPGKAGFKGSRKSTPFAAQVAAEVVGKIAYDAGMRKIEVHLFGAGNGRESAIRALAAAGLKVTAIKDYTAVPHNGCRPPKRRRV
jgi:small subunit ribosomal protein S11